MKTVFFFALAFTVSIVLSACGSTLPPHIAVQFATPSPTPFLPENEIAESLNEKDEIPEIFEELEKTWPNEEINSEVSQVTLEGFPEPSFYSDAVIPSPFPSFSFEDGHQNILILGSDQRPDDGGFRTDVILLLSIDKDNQKVNLLSIPRDLYLYQPGYRMDRINSAHARGGPELTFLTFEYNFGFRPDNYILVNFNGFSKIIDSLGGINVDVAQSISDHRDAYGNFTVNAGRINMDSETALWYVRSRGTSNDFDRTRRQQEVLVAIFKSAFKLDLYRNATDLYQAYKESISSDLGLEDIFQLLPTASQVFSSEKIGNFVIGAEEVDPWITSGNAQVLLPNHEKLLPLLREVLFLNN